MRLSELGRKPNILKVRAEYRLSKPLRSKKELGLEHPYDFRRAGWAALHTGPLAGHDVTARSAATRNTAKDQRLPAHDLR